jgi:hypothetical protein
VKKEGNPIRRETITHSKNSGKHNQEVYKNSKEGKHNIRGKCKVYYKREGSGDEGRNKTVRGI